MFKIWEGLRSKADKDNDGQVSAVITIIVQSLSTVDPKNTQKRFFYDFESCVPSPASGFVHNDEKLTIIKIVITKLSSLYQPHTKASRSLLCLPLYIDFYCCRALTW